MKKQHFFCIVLMVMTMQVTLAQGVGINTDGTAPDGSALLDIKAPASGNQLGMLIPRTNLATATFPSPGPATYLQLVNTNALYAFPANSRFNNGIGMYMNFGTPASPVWRRFLTSADSTLFWGLRGNAGTNPANDYIGTSDGQNLSIRTNALQRILIPTSSSDDMVISNVLGLLLPTGTPTVPSLKFLAGNLGISGLTGSGNSGVAIRSASNMYTYFSQNGIRLTSSSAVGNWLPESSALDILGNIYTRNKIVYSEFGAVPTTTTPDKTFKNEFHWDGVIAAGSDSPDLFNENNTIKFVVRRNAVDEYFIRIAATNGRTFTCANNLNEVTAVTTTGIANFLPVNFATEVIGPNATQTVIIREQIASAPTYRFTIMVANHNVSVVIERWQN